MLDIEFSVEFQKAALNGDVGRVRALGANRLDSDGYSGLMLLLMADTWFVADPDFEEPLRIPVTEAMQAVGVMTALAAGADVRFRADGTTAIEIARRKEYGTIVPLLEAAAKEQEGRPMPERDRAGGGWFAWALSPLLRA